MITVDDKYKVRPITKSLAIFNFEQGDKVLAIVGEPNDITAAKIFNPTHHDIKELLETDYADANWFADWE